MAYFTRAKMVTRALVTVVIRTDPHPALETSTPSKGPSRIPPIDPNPLTKLVTPAPEPSFPPISAVMAPIRTESGPQLQIPMINKRAATKADPSIDPATEKTVMAIIPITVALYITFNL